MTTTADGMSRAVEAKTVSGLVPWYLMASVMYYHMDAPILSDARYDEIARTLDERWDEVEHEHKKLIDRDSLKTGSLFALKLEDYPLRTRAAAVAVAKDIVKLTAHQRGVLLGTHRGAPTFIPAPSVRTRTRPQPAATAEAPAPLPEVRVRTRVRPA